MIKLLNYYSLAKEILDKNYELALIILEGEINNSDFCNNIDEKLYISGYCLSDINLFTICYLSIFK